MCDCCTEGHDHHCGVFGVCICDQNIKYFAMFPVYAGLMFIMMGTSNLVTNSGISNNQDMASVVNNVSSMALFVFGISILCFGLFFWTMGICPSLSDKETQ